MGMDGFVTSKLTDIDGFATFKLTGMDGFTTFALTGRDGFVGKLFKAPFKVKHLP
jgi:hypothetical protein